MLAVITSYFNPAGYSRLKQNYREFCERMAGAEANLFAIEADFQAEQVCPQARVLKATQHQVMWQKERLINLAVESLPSQFEYVAWIDADVLFLSRNWQEQIVQELQKHPVIQCFSHVHKLDSTGAVLETQPCGVASVDGAPGFAWAAGREFLDRCGLYDRHIAGSADILMLDAWRGQLASRHTDCMNLKWREDYLRWARLAWVAAGGNLGWIDGDIIHFWHGNWKDRKYRARWRYCTDHEFDPTSDLVTGANGLYEWAGNKPAMESAMANYFLERKEDG